MIARIATMDEITSWNSHILSNPDGGNVFQGKEFAEQKQLSGWIPRYVFINELAITVLEKSIFGLGKVWYLPKGPGVTSVRQLAEILPQLKGMADSLGVFVIKIEPELLQDKQTVTDLLKLGLLKVTPIQPNFSTVTLDLTASLDDILANLNQKGRHAIKRAQRDGVTVKQVEASDENCQKMYRLLAATAEGSFRIRNYGYYRTFWQRYESADEGQLFFAYVDNKIIAGAYGLIFGEKSTYKDGASVKERTVYGASHLLQWQLICWAKLKGASKHDFCGSPPSEHIKDATHPHYGIGRFKTSFNKQVTDYVGVYDLPVRRSAYKLWRKLGERIVVKLHNMRFHENWY